MNMKNVNTYIMLGTISEVKESKARISLIETTTDFLPILSFASTAKVVHTPIKVGEQVIILAPFGDFNSGFILRGLYGAKNMKPNVTEDDDIIEYSDGTIMKYNVAESTLTIDCNDKINIIAKGDISITCENASVKANSDISVECSNASIKASDDVNVECANANVTASKVTIDSNDINLGVGGAGVVTTECTCSLTGVPHPVGSGSVKAIM